MALLLYFLFLAVLGACNCAATEDAGLSRRDASSWPAAGFPIGIHISGGAYSDRTNGNYTASDTMYNSYPIYKGGNNNAWSMYRRSGGYAEDQWVLDFNDVSDDWSGTVAHSQDEVVLPYLSQNWKSGTRTDMVVSANYFDLNTVVVGGATTDMYLNGKYTFKGDYHNGYPMYRMGDAMLFRGDDDIWYASTTINPTTDPDSQPIGNAGDIFPVQLN